jgi:hypothetical protein
MPRSHSCYDPGSPGEVLMNDPTTCPHTRTQLIAKDADAEYVECLDCGAILESGERNEASPGFNESLSDA